MRWVASHFPTNATSRLPVRDGFQDNTPIGLRPSDEERLIKRFAFDLELIGGLYQNIADGRRSQEQSRQLRSLMVEANELSESLKSAHARVGQIVRKVLPKSLWHYFL
jgi:hypothetical protein